MSVRLPYNPFSCELKEIIPEQLGTLRDISEGWYVEYKGEIVPAKSIAKSMAAFANHYGGWIFYGISGSRDGRNVAADFPGLTKSNLKFLLEWLQAAAKDIISPSPFFEYHILNGPCIEIGLESEKSIVIVMVPSGADAPYIHNDGKIYRRVADASDPKPETDKSTLDLLWQRGQRARTLLADFLRQKPILSKTEENVTFMDIFLLPDPLNVANYRSSLKFDQFVEMMSDASSLVFNVPYDNFYSISDGFIARQAVDNDPYHFTPIWRFYRNSSSIISLPFSSTQIGGLHLTKWLNGYEYRDEFLNQIDIESLAASHLIDLNQLVVFMFAIIGRQRQLMEAGGVKSLLYAKVAIYNCWRRIPYLDTKPFVDFIAKHGVPVIQYDEVFAPPDTTYESLRLIDIDYSKSTSDTQAKDATRLTVDVLNALGFPTFPGYSEGLWETSERAAKANQLRSKNMGNQKK